MSETESSVIPTAQTDVTRFRPCFDKILVRPHREAAVTASGLIIPPTAQARTSYATVVAAGPGRIDQAGERIPMGCAVGDVVVMPEYYGQPVRFGDEALVATFESEVLGVVEN